MILIDAFVIYSIYLEKIMTINKNKLSLINIKLQKFLGHPVLKIQNQDI